MADATPCKTPGAQYQIGITSTFITGTVLLPFKLELDEAEAEILETDIHNALELVLAAHFVKHQRA